ncbi:hypothetical protein JNW91_14065 [Micromonospora sp. STR1_7]|uniref:Uncharacterized protein n=1 Tax=Micromonospora parastrephiae TaxID=2806101 RepID=A0ABS1XUF3_9ACTN|nr:hypothetical protein [Micromonospora parastrephiae]MBM0232886.1 hypothetical protein [Micromonospora parastrephiae]
MRKLSGAEVRELRKAHRCPDCTSEVTVDRRGGRVGVKHDDTCPMYARLKRAGMTSALIFTRAPGQSDRDFTREVNAAVADLAQTTGAPVRITEDPYRGTPQ